MSKTLQSGGIIVDLSIALSSKAVNLKVVFETNLNYSVFNKPTGYSILTKINIFNVNAEMLNLLLSKKFLI